MAKVKNRSNGKAVYIIPELGDKRNIRREFAPHEIKEIPAEELEALTYIGGGEQILKNYLQILDKDALAKVNLEVEPEYAMSEEDVKKLMREGTLDAFKDCLDFAPQAIKDMIKDYAVSLPLNDSAKRDAIKEILKFDVDRAILNKKASEETDAPKEEEKTRRVEPAASTGGRRTAAPKYEIID
jgi:hypothetical protein